MAGILSIDRNWEVVFPWTYSVDTRARKYLEEIEDNMGSRIRKSSGGVPLTAAKMKWVKKEFPKEYRKSHKFLNLMTYVAGKLANVDPNEAFIDYSVLAMSGLADIEKGIWNIDIVRELDLDPNKLPLIVRPYDTIGTISRKMFNTVNDIRVLAGMGDQVAGFIGAGVFNKGDLIDVAGTYSVLGYATDSFVTDTEAKTISTIYSGIEDIYYHLGVVALGGYLHNWFKDRFGYDNYMCKNPSEDTRDLFFIPHLGGRNSPSQPYYKGVFYGLQWNHNIDSMYTAMLECMGYEYSFILENIKRLNSLDRNMLDRIKAIGGGAKNNIWNRIKAEILGLEYIIMEDIPFEIIGDYLVARYGKDLRKNCMNITGSVLERIRPEKDKERYYQTQKTRYEKVVNGIGKIYREME